MLVVHRKLEQAKAKCKKWCLEYKKDNKVEWEAINLELTNLQQKLDHK